MVRRTIYIHCIYIRRQIPQQTRLCGVCSG